MNRQQLIEDIVLKLTHDIMSLHDGEKEHYIMYLLEKVVPEKCRKYNPECVEVHPESFDLQWLEFGTRPLSHNDINHVLIQWYTRQDKTARKRSIGVLGKTIKEKIEFLTSRGYPPDMFPREVTRNTDRFL